MNEILKAYQEMLWVQSDPTLVAAHRRIAKAWLPLFTTWVGMDPERLKQLQGTMVEFAIHKEVSGANN